MKLSALAIAFSMIAVTFGATLGIRTDESATCIGNGGYCVNGGGCCNVCDGTYCQPANEGGVGPRCDANKVCYIGHCDKPGAICTLGCENGETCGYGGKCLYGLCQSTDSCNYQKDCPEGKKCEEVIYDDGDPLGDLVGRSGQSFARDDGDDEPIDGVCV